MTDALVHVIAWLGIIGVVWAMIAQIPMQPIARIMVAMVWGAISILILAQFAGPVAGLHLR